ncbi:MAG: hypothetical protein ACC631_03930 [Halocynthiibacter sp.]
MPRLNLISCLPPLQVLASEPTTNQPENLSEIRADLDGDGRADFAYLFASQDSTGDITASLTIEAASGKTNHVTAMAWMGASTGTIPNLGMTKRGSLQVNSMNESIGRDHWFQTVTIAYRDGEFRLAGFSYSWFDTLDPIHQGLCAATYLTGGGEPVLGEARTRSAFSVFAGSVPIQDWLGDLPKPCQQD